MIKTLAAAGIFALAGSTAALADYSRHSRFDARLSEQQRQIELGRQTGSITWREGLALRAEHREIMKLRNQLSADGRLSRHERRALRQRLESSADLISVKQSNARRRLWWAPRVGK